MGGEDAEAFADPEVRRLGGALDGLAVAAMALGERLVVGGSRRAFPAGVASLATGLRRTGNAGYGECVGSAASRACGGRNSSSARA